MNESYVPWLMLVIVIGLIWWILYSAILLGRKVQREQNFIRRRMECIFKHHDHLLSTTNAMYEDGRMLIQWKDAHPLGAVTESEHKEWSELVMQYIGSYIIFQVAHGFPIDQAHIDYLWETVEDWRI